MAGTNKELMLLIILMLVFAAFFFISLINLRRDAPVFGFGISYLIEDYLIMLLSVLTIARLFWSVVKH